MRVLKIAWKVVIVFPAVAGFVIALGGNYQEGTFFMALAAVQLLLDQERK